MIKASEIRVGNVFSHNGSWNYADHKGPFQFQERDWYAVGESTLSLEDIDPIPLTPEILQQCGFKEKKLPFNYCNGNNGYEIVIRESAERYLLVTFSLTTVYDSGNIFAGQPSGLVHALHELQNLYFALTGLELTVNLL